MEKVSIARCGSYQHDDIITALKRLLAPFGGMESFVKPGMQVLLKPNMLAARKPEEAVTTHPALVGAVVQLVRNAGGTALVGDSPGIGSFAKVGDKSGICKAVELAGGQMIAFDKTRTISGGSTFRSMELARAYCDADLVINLPKLKTHEMMTLTCAVKNLFGAVVGPAKAGLHLTAGHSKQLFARLLLEIASARPVALTIVDGITAMEGNGPSSGTPLHLGVLLAGENPVAVDTVAARIAGIEQKHLPVEQEAARLEMPGSSLKQIELLGEQIQMPLQKAFKLPEGLDLHFGIPGFLKPLLRNQLSQLPVADLKLCQLCGICRDACPPQAITIKNNTLKVDKEHCIRCWCCRELCPYHAMKLRKGFLLRILNSK